MNNQSLTDRAQLKRSLIMKVGSAVLGLHIVALVAFALTQGCVTPESQGSGRGAGARHKGIVKHQHKGKTSGSQTAITDPYAMDSADATDSMDDSVIIDSTDTGSAAPYIAPVAPTSNTETYIVQQGDMLSKLAVRFNTSTKTLISMNNLSNPDVLYVGQELRVPAGSLSSGGSSSAPQSYSSVKKGGEYTIQKGDTLSGIAIAAGVSLDDLRSLNNITDDKIFEGKKINIPSGGKVPTNTQKSTPKKADPPAEKTADDSIEAPAPLVPVVDDTTNDSMSVDAVIDHVVYPGETLADIARQYNVTRSKIMRLNNISDEAAIKEGQRLRIPISE